MSLVSTYLDRRSVEIGRQWFTKLGIPYEIVEMDALNLQFPNDTFDVSLSFSAIWGAPPKVDTKLRNKKK